MQYFLAHHHFHTIADGVCNYNTYRSLAKNGPWAVHITLCSDRYIYLRLPF